MSNTLFLCADIGATNARFASVTQSADGQLSVGDKNIYSSAGYDSFEKLLEDVIKDFGSDFSAAAFALPGPIVNNCCKVTNLPWDVCSEQVSSQIGFRSYLLNDLEAQGWGIDMIPAQNKHALTDIKPVNGNACIIAPGSDLGEAILYWDGSIHLPFPTEGGHCDFSPIDEFEFRLTELLQEQYGHARWGQIISGPGITSLYRLISSNSDCCLAGEEITNAAISNHDASATETLNRFVSMLGRECSNLALKSMAVGGVYIAGGIVPTLPMEWLKTTLMESFRDKPSMKSLLEEIPIYVIDSDNLGILGSANYLAHR